MLNLLLVRAVAAPPSVARRAPDSAGRRSPAVSAILLRERCLSRTGPCAAIRNAERNCRNASGKPRRRSQRHLHDRNGIAVPVTHQSRHRLAPGPVLHKRVHDATPRTAPGPQHSPLEDIDILQRDCGTRRRSPTGAATLTNLPRAVPERSGRGSRQFGWREQRAVSTASA